MATENNSKNKHRLETDTASDKTNKGTSTGKDAPKEDVKPSESKKLVKEASYKSEVKGKVEESMDKKKKK